MKILLIWPEFPPSYWSFEKVIDIVGKKTFMPPLGLVTVAGMLPAEWSYRLIDENIKAVSEADWAWADAVMLSAMIVQKDELGRHIGEARRRGLPVVVGGPFVTSVPEFAEAAGADYIVMDEGEITIPPMLDALRADPAWRRGDGEAARRFNAAGKKPEMSLAKLPRYDLLDLDAYAMMSVQFSRGCPFLCEFCDIINLYGRVPRTKPTNQLLDELQMLYDLGWRGGVFLVDDNFIGNKKNVKALLHELRDWHRARGNPFDFDTEASVDLAADDEMLQLMVECNFAAVFLGIETPDVESLELTRKHQNNRTSMLDSVTKINRLGIRVNGGFIIGFDNEKQGAGKRIATFVDEAKIPFAVLSMLQALPNTGLWTRLEKEGRLRGEFGDLDQTTVLNFAPTRPTAEIVTEYLGAVSAINDPVGYMTRMYKHALEYRADYPDLPPLTATPEPSKLEKKGWAAIKAGLRYNLKAGKTLWMQGVWRKSRRVFWRQSFDLLRKRPDNFGHFLMLCAHNEHFIELTDLVCSTLEPQIATLSGEIVDQVKVAGPKGKARAPELKTHLAAE